MYIFSLVESTIAEFYIQAIYEEKLVKPVQTLPLRPIKYVGIAITNPVTSVFEQTLVVGTTVTNKKVEDAILLYASDNENVIHRYSSWNEDVRIGVCIQ